MTESTSPEPASEREGPINCGLCQTAIAEPGYAAPLCASCRDQLARRSFPVGVKLGAVLILAALAFSLTRIDRTIHAGVSFTRGQRAEKDRDYAQAVQHYQEAAAIFPESPQVLVRLARAYYKVGEVDKAAETLNRLAGQTIPTDLVPDYKRVFDKIDSELRWRSGGDNHVHPR